MYHYTRYHVPLYTSSCQNNQFQRKFVGQKTHIWIFTPPPHFRFSYGPGHILQYTLSCTTIHINMYYSRRHHAYVLPLYTLSCSTVLSIYMIIYHNTYTTSRISVQVIMYYTTHQIVLQ